MSREITEAIETAQRAIDRVGEDGLVDVEEDLRAGLSNLGRLIEENPGYRGDDEQTLWEIAKDLIYDLIVYEPLVAAQAPLFVFSGFSNPAEMVTDDMKGYMFALYPYTEETTGRPFVMVFDDPSFAGRVSPGEIGHALWGVAYELSQSPVSPDLLEVLEENAMGLLSRAAMLGDEDINGNTAVNGGRYLLSAFPKGSARYTEVFGLVQALELRFGGLQGGPGGGGTPGVPQSRVDFD